MRLVTFAPRGEPHDERLGALRGDDVVDLSASGAPGLASAAAYLAGLPGTFDSARRLVDDHRTPATPRGDVLLLPPLPRPAALLDFGLTPTHLRAAGQTLLRRTLPPWCGPLVAQACGPLLARSGGLRHYKGNHLAVSGPDRTIPWPGFTAYLDIEPELAFAVGSGGRIGGYLVLNDLSARDVQAPEMFGTGPSTCKDFPAGNGLGPWLVTPDEVPDPLALAVTVEFDSSRPPWRGSTSAYTAPPERVLAHLAERREMPPGVVVGMGTTPGCSGLDRDEWLQPGEEFTITIERLGSLRQRLGVPAGVPDTRWTPPAWLAATRGGAAPARSAPA